VFGGRNESKLALRLATEMRKPRIWVSPPTGLLLLLHKSTQGLRTWARLFRASGAGASMVLGNFDVLKIA